jgi:hypothetical protein
VNENIEKASGIDLVNVKTEWPIMKSDEKITWPP